MRFNMYKFILLWTTSIFFQEITDTLWTHKCKTCCTKMTNNDKLYSSQVTRRVTGVQNNFLTSVHTLYCNLHSPYFNLLLKLIVEAAIIEAIQFCSSLNRTASSHQSRILSNLSYWSLLPKLFIILMSLRGNHLARVLMPLILWLPMREWKVPILDHMLEQEEVTNNNYILIIYSAYGEFSNITI